MRIRRAGALSLLLALGIPSLAAADPPAPAFVLPELGHLTLTLPKLLAPVPPPVAQSGESGFAVHYPVLSAIFFHDYWHLPALSLASNFLSESERSFRIDTFNASFGAWGLHGATVHQPSYLSECTRDCTDGTWDGRVSLDYDLGKIGPVEHASPFLEVRRLGETTLRPRGSVLMHAGVSGHF
jgi:hypothetical protein